MTRKCSGIWANGQFMRKWWVEGECFSSFPQSFSIGFDADTEEDYLTRWSKRVQTPEPNQFQDGTDRAAILYISNIVERLDTSSEWICLLQVTCFHEPNFLFGFVLRNLQFGDRFRKTMIIASKYPCHCALRWILEPSERNKSREGQKKRKNSKTFERHWMDKRMWPVSSASIVGL